MKWLPNLSTDVSHHARVHNLSHPFIITDFSVCLNGSDLFNLVPLQFSCCHTLIPICVMGLSHSSCSQIGFVLRLEYRYNIALREFDLCPPDTVKVNT
jgi:hypothetical protein